MMNNQIPDIHIMLAVLISQEEEFVARERRAFRNKINTGRFV
jgi:hypothetical protein